MKNSIRLDFQLLGTTVSPQEISKITGVTPDTELLRGQRNKERDLPRQNLWSLESHVDSNDVEEHWSSLEKVLNGAKEHFKEIGKTGRTKITIVVQGGTRLPSIAIPSSMSKFAGFVEAEIDIDHLQ